VPMYICVLGWVISLCRMVGVFMNDELKRMWKEGFVTWPRYYPDVYWRD
jgi:hypothetical protein